MPLVWTDIGGRPANRDEGDMFRNGIQAIRVHLVNIACLNVLAADPFEILN